MDLTKRRIILRKFDCALYFLTSVTRLGDLWNFIVTNFIKEKSKYLVTFWAKVKAEF